MREKYLWLAIAVLTALTLGQSCYIYERNLSAKEAFEKEPLRTEIHKSFQVEKAVDAQWEEFEKWRDRIQKQLNQGNPLLERDFDAFFNDRFFSGKFSPFTELERIHRQMSDEFEGAEKNLFEDYWDKWFGQRMRMGRFKTDILRTGRDVTIIIHAPGLDGKTAEINITDDRIRMFFSAKTASEEKSAGGTVKRESSQSYVKILPIPEDAEAGTGKVEIDGERVIIKFALKTSRI